MNTTTSSVSHWCHNRPSASLWVAWISLSADWVCQLGVVDRFHVRYQLIRKWSFPCLRLFTPDILAPRVIARWALPSSATPFVTPRLDLIDVYLQFSPSRFNVLMHHRASSTEIRPYQLLTDGYTVRCLPLSSQSQLITLLWHSVIKRAPYSGTNTWSIISCPPLFVL